MLGLIDKKDVTRHAPKAPKRAPTHAHLDEVSRMLAEVSRVLAEVYRSLPSPRTSPIRLPL